MIITDPTKRPSERFIETISDYFTSNNFEFKKSRKSFFRQTDNGFEEVGIQIYNSVGLVSVSVSWSKSLRALEKIFAALNGEPKKYKNKITLYTHLSIHTRREPKRVHTWDLFDSKTQSCDDRVLNNASKGFINAYETYITRFFEYYDNYLNLEEILNIVPVKHTPFSMGYFGYGKQLAIGLLLAKFFEKPIIDSLVTEYKTFALTLPPEGQKDILDMADKTIKFIEQNNIKDLLNE